jgi:hypothetical protein
MRLRYLLLPLLILWGCDENSSKPCPVYETGAVEGYVTIAGEPAVTTIGVRPFEGPQRFEQIAVSQSDSSGWYHIELPNGLYRLFAPPETASGTFSGYRDTVRIESESTRFDILRTKFRARLMFPNLLNDRNCSGRLEGRDDYTMDEKIVGGAVEFSIPIMTPGDYKFSIRVRSANYWLPGTYDYSEAETFTLTGFDSMLITDSFLNYATVSGTVSGSWQNSEIGYPRVTAFAADSTIILYKNVNRDGEFTIELFEPQPIRLLVSLRGIDNWIGGDDFVSATEFDVQPQQELVGITHMESGFSCALSVRPPHVITGGTARLRDSDGHVYFPTYFANDRFAVSNLSPGTYYLFISGYCQDQTWASQWYDRGEQLDSATPIVIGDYEFQELTMELQAGGTIDGLITRDSGMQTDNFKVLLCSVSGEPLCSGWTYTDDSYFQFTGLGNDSYTVAVLDDIHELWYYPGTTAADSATVITIHDYNNVTGIDWSLRPRTK